MIILETTDTPKCIVGFGPTNKPIVIWNDVSNIKELPGGVSFTEESKRYMYIFCYENKQYTEIKNKAPDFTRYEILSEEEILKRGYLKSFKTENTLDCLGVLEDNLEDDEDDDYEHKRCYHYVDYCGGYYKNGC